MSASRLLIAPLVVLLLAVPILPGPSTAQPSQGDWVVTGSQVVQNESITLNGNLTVESGGNLTLAHDTLTMNPSYNGEYGIMVDPGGSLYVYGSTVTAANLSQGYFFVVDGSNFVMKSSRIHGAGWCDTSLSQCASAVGGGAWQGLPLFPFGLEVETNGATVEGNLLSMDGVGLTLTGSYATVQANTIVNNGLAGMLIANNAKNTFANNFVNYTASFVATVVIVGNSNANTFRNNTIGGSFQMVSGNEIGSFGLNFYDSWNNTIIDNTISTSNAIWFDGSSDNVAVGNKLGGVPSEYGVYILSGVSNRILNNTIQVISQPSGSNGIVMSAAHNSTVAGNAIYGQQGGSIAMFGTSGSHVLDNRITSPNFETISLFGSQNNILKGNLVTNTETGISLDYLSNGNLISDNEVVANSTLFNDCCGYGIKVHDSSGNSIFQNDFIGGNLGPYDNGNNTWYSQGSGNYWSLRTGTGPYQIPPDGLDPYPLSNPVTVRAVTMVNTTFAATPQNIPTPTLPSTVLNIANKTTTVGSANVVVNDSVAIENSVVTLGTQGQAGVTIVAGGSLTIENSTIYWEQGGPNVLSGGSLIIKDSRMVVGQKGQFLLGMTGSISMTGSALMSTPNGFGWMIQNRGPAPDSTAQLVNSSFYSYGTLSSDISGPVALYSITRMDIQNDYFAGCQSIGAGNYNGGAASTFRFVGNKFFDVSIPLFYTDNDVYGPSIHYNSTLYISGNEFSSDVLVIGGNITFTNNDVTDGIEGIYGNNIILTENNFFAGNIPVQGGSVVANGNYWSNYGGKDPDLDGVGDTPYNSGGVTDNQPYIDPNGWLTKFYLTLDTNLPPSTAFQVNGTSFILGQEGTTTLRLGYAAAYSLTLPQSVKLANGSILGFSRWGDGGTSATRTLKLLANSTLQAVYALEAPTTTTTSSSSTTTTTSSTSTTASSITSTATTTTSSRSSTTGPSSSTLTTSSSSSTAIGSTTTTPQTSLTLELAVLGVVAVVLVVVGGLFLRRYSH